MGILYSPIITWNIRQPKVHHKSGDIPINTHRLAMPHILDVCRMCQRKCGFQKSHESAAIFKASAKGFKCDVQCLAGHVEACGNRPAPSHLLLRSASLMRFYAGFSRGFSPAQARELGNPFSGTKRGEVALSECQERRRPAIGHFNCA